MSWRDGFERMPPLGPDHVELGSATALVIVDMQYIDAHRAYGFGKWLVEEYTEFGTYYCDRIESIVIPNAQRLLAAFRGHGMRVIHLTLGPELPDGADFAGLDTSHMLESKPGSPPVAYHRGTLEHRILPELTPVEGELVVNKTSRGAFNSTALERTLRSMGISTLLVTGVATSVCVDLTARDAADRGFGAIVVEDATADLTEAWHQAALLQFALRWGKVMTSDEALNAIAALRAA